MSAPARIRFVVLEGELDEATVAQIREAISQPETTMVYSMPTIAAIVERVSYETGVYQHIIVGPSQAAGATRARYAALWIAHRWAGKSTGMLMRAFSDRDHSTILHGVAKAQTLRQRDPAFLALTDKVIAHFSGGQL
jgi:chromosomal replication initiation ATPase DnaA